MAPFRSPVGTEVPLPAAVWSVKSRHMAKTANCEELEQFRREAAAALLEAKKVRRTKDLTFLEDAELSRESRRRIDALIKHLLAGHDGSPCPAGDRPIVKSRATNA